MVSLSKDFPKVIVDQQSETLRELMVHWPKGERSLQLFVNERVSSGAWEAVYKKVKNRLVPSYRRARR